MAEKKKMSDSVKPTATFAKLTKEITPIEEFKIGFSCGKIVTFPDVFGMDEERADQLLRRLDGSSLPRDVLPLWLSNEDWEFLQSQRLSMRELLTVMEAATAHYEQVHGTPGEGFASHS